MDDLIGICGLELDCIVGTWPAERVKPQRVRVDVGLRQELSRAGRSGRIAHTTDYDRVARQVEAMLRFRAYHLIEMAAEEVCAMILGVHPAVREVTLRIEKPGALEGRARGAYVQVQRRAEHYASASSSPSSEVQRLVETREAVLDLVAVQAGASTPIAELSSSSCLLWPILGQFALDGKPMPDDAASVLTTIPPHSVLILTSAGSGQFLRCLKKVDFE